MAIERKSRVVTVSLPPEDAEVFERIAQAEGRSRSEMFRRMLAEYRRYLDVQAFESLQRYGAARAAAVGVRTEADVERVIRDSRA